MNTTDILKLIAKGIRSTIDEDEDDEDVMYPSSEAVLRAEYNPEDRELNITYTTGGNYIYLNVSPQRWRAFEAALSKGKYINYKIKPTYSYVRD